jgi:hypothetical protein
MKAYRLILCEAPAAEGEAAGRPLEIVEFEREVEPTSIIAEVRRIEIESREDIDDLLLSTVSKMVRRVWDRVVKEDADLFGGSVLDLMADNIDRVSLADLKAAIVVSGIFPEANARIQAQIASYR